MKMFYTFPKQLYKRNNERLEIVDYNGNTATMSEYRIDNNEHKKCWIAKIGIDEFIISIIDYMKFKKKKR